MKVYSDISLKEFEFWSGAKDNAEKLTDEEMDALENILLEMKENWEDVEINDLFWFDFETICEWLGLEYDSQTGDVLREEDKESFEIKVYNIEYDEEGDECFEDLPKEMIFETEECFKKDLEDKVQEFIDDLDYCVNSYNWEIIEEGC